ncbi:hypothetical protein PanWU01x14_372090 [Parasponia andersonii]|uniref:Reverse transcriptase domain containing protein n=1 Tax=Parasponia andersonii TaxID=3476 RepID=A0A2P5A3V4_PARAD|nr:hypothetical protein PanWU01x14_372090 [Parasponia andersonii]
MGSLKASGLDGLSILFYKHYWLIVVSYFVETIRNFFLTGHINRTLNMPNMVLIPKVEQPTFINQFCPISFCNVTYKVISKMVANRLKPLLTNLICPTQVVFVRPKQINL